MHNSIQSPSIFSYYESEHRQSLVKIDEAREKYEKSVKSTLKPQKKIYLKSLDLNLKP